MSYRSSVLGPRFFLQIDGKSTEDLAPFITKYEFIDNEKKADQLSISVNNKSLRFQDDERFHKGARLKTRYGYSNDVSDIKEMVIVDIEHSLDADSIPLISVKATDSRFAMTKGSHAINWGSKSTSAIVKEIATRWNMDKKKLATSEGQRELSVEVARQLAIREKVRDSKDARKEMRVQPAAVSDVEFAMRLADKLNWDLYFKGGSLFMEPKDFTKAPALRYTYFTDGNGGSDVLLSFSSSKNMKGGKRRKAQVGVSGTTGGVASSAEKLSSEPEDAQSTMPESGYAGDHDFTVITDEGALVGPSYEPTPETNPEVVKKHAAAANDKAAELLKADITVVGTPRLRARDMVRLEGVGRLYSGNWRVKEVKHTFTASSKVYTSSASVSRNASSLGDKKDKKKAGSNTKPVGPEKSDSDLITVFTDIGGIEEF